MLYSELIKSSITTQQVVRFYGFEPNRAGFIKCPFHSDKTGSLKIYSGDRGWHCFGCHSGGSVIDFVMKLFELSFKDACARLNEDFRLGLDLSAPTDTDALRRLRAVQNAQKREKEKIDAEYRNMADEHRRLYQAKMNKAPEPNDVDWDDEFCEALRKLPEIEEWFLENEYVRK